jgi:acetyltransferase
MPGSFGELTPLLAPRSVAVVGASDREGNLGGLAVGFLRKFGYRGAIWPVNAGRDVVGTLPCYPSLAALPAVPDQAVIAVPAESVVRVVEECIAAGVPAAVVWAGGFAETGAEGRARQRALEDACRGTGLKLCGPNCIGIINTAIGLTASFSSLMTEVDRFTPGAVSIVSQSGGIAVTAHARAQELGLGFRVTVSCGNEAVLGIPDFVRALVQDDATRVIAVYTEGLSDPAAFVEALAEARRAAKPVVVLKGGATEASGQAALAHTGRLVGLDRACDAILREFAAIRVSSSEEMLDVCLQLASLRPGQLPAGNRVLLSSFGGGSGVLGTDQCAREGLAVPPLDPGTRGQVAPLFTPLASTLNPIDLTPGSMTNPQLRARLPRALAALAAAPDIDLCVFLASGFGPLVPELATMLEELRRQTDRPFCLSWLSPPPGIAERFAAQGIRVFDEHARAIRAAGHLARHGADTRHRIRHRPERQRPFPWSDFVPASTGRRVVPEHVAARILEAAGLPVAAGRLAPTTDDAVRAAHEVGFPVAVKGISAAITHRAAAGLVALDVDSPEAVARVDRALRARAAALGATLEGTWVQRMVPRGVELLVTGFRDPEFGVMVGCGMGGGTTELIDDAVLARAPVDADGAFDLLDRLRTLRRFPDLLARGRRERAAEFVARFSAVVATAPWPGFTFEVNPLEVGPEHLAAVDGLLVIE